MTFLLNIISISENKSKKCESSSLTICMDGVNDLIYGKRNEMF